LLDCRRTEETQKKTIVAGRPVINPLDWALTVSGHSCPESIEGQLMQAAGKHCNVVMVAAAVEKKKLMTRGTAGA
jgi:hypothetical protein